MLPRLRFPPNTYDVWHDRAVCHFLTVAADRVAYVESVRKSVKAGGHVVIGTFGPEGPSKCSGLDSVKEMHETPFGTKQQFLYCFCIVE
jgi:hypothetical protein